MSNFNFNLNVLLSKFFSKPSISKIEFGSIITSPSFLNKLIIDISIILEFK